MSLLCAAYTYSTYGKCCIYVLYPCTYDTMPISHDYVAHMYVCVYVSQGLCVYSTSSVVPEYSTLRIIIKCAGGEVSNRVIRTLTMYPLYGVYISIHEVNIRMCYFHACHFNLINY